MTGAVLLALLVLLLLVALTIGVSALARNRLLRRHRVDPAVPTGAPLAWLVDPRGTARLHRRLARVGTATTAVAEADRGRRGVLRRRPEPTPLQAAAIDLRDQAVDLDRRLTHLALLAPAARRGHLGRIHRSVTDLEAATARLVVLHGEVVQPPELAGTPDPLTRSAERVDHLTRAHEELTRLDVANGLDRHRWEPEPPAAATR